MLTRIPLTSGRFIIAGSSQAKASRDWVVYLPESGAEFQEGSRLELAHHVGSELAARFNYLVVNKSGLGPLGADEAVFERSFRRDLRVGDALSAMKRIVPRDGKIFLVGYSEGAYLAPEIARRDGRVAAVAMIGGGTRGWLKEELSHASGGKKAEVEKVVRRIYREPESTEKWHDFSFATWYSYREDRTLKALKGLNKPVLALLGARDRVIDMKSTLADLKALKSKQNLKVQVIRDCGHEFDGHWVTVRRALSDFLQAE